MSVTTLVECRVLNSTIITSVGLQNLWRRLYPIPGGKWIFSRLITWANPYTGSIRANVLALKPGYARIELKDKRRIRNHLNSIHAVALVNLGEFTSGLALLSTLGTKVRGIPTHISVEFIKKARGKLIAESHCKPPAVQDDMEFVVHTDIRDSSDELVARTTVCWRLGLHSTY